MYYFLEALSITNMAVINIKLLIYTRKSINHQNKRHTNTKQI